MTDREVRGRFRFTLRTLLLTVLAVALLAATLVNKRDSQVMWQFSEADGGDAMYGTSYGWPFAFLRLPIGRYAHVPADWFIPGLIANVAVVVLAWVSLHFAWRLVQRTRLRRSSTDA